AMCCCLLRCGNGGRSADRPCCGAAESPTRPSWKTLGSREVPAAPASGSRRGGCCDCCTGRCGDCGCWVGCRADSDWWRPSEPVGRVVWFADPFTVRLGARLLGNGGFDSVECPFRCTSGCSCSCPFN